MKKFLTLTLIGTAILALGACSSKKTTTKESTTAKPTTVKPTTTVAPTTTKAKEEIKVLTPAGTPLVGLAGIIGSEAVDVEAVDGPTLLVSGLSTKTHDIIVAPLTAGAQVAIKGKSEYKLDSVITINNTYIISKKGTKLDNLEDLKGKKLVAYGENNTPDLALKTALKNNNIETTDLTIDYEQSVQLATSTFLPDSSTYDYCLIAEPQITTLKVKQNKELNVLDLSEYMGDNVTIYQAGIFVNPESNQTRCNEVISQIKENITSMNANPTEYAKNVVNKNDSLKTMGEAVLAASIPNSNITFINAKENKDKILAYYEMLNAFNPNVLGGMVTDEFFR